MEVAAAAMDFHALSRRELQALCKRNGVRANMTNAAMADALQSLPSVDGIDEIGTTLCLPTPGRSTMKSALKAAAAVGEEEEQQQHGSPLPRGRRVSVKSPEAIRMGIEEGEDEMKRDLIKEIVRTPGVALHSTSRRARPTPAPIPTQAASSVRATTRRTAARKAEEAVPTPATVRRSQRMAARKASFPVEEEVVTTTKRASMRSTRSKVMIDLDQEMEEMAAVPQQEKVQKVDSEVASDEKCDEPEDEETTKLLEEGNAKDEESEQGEEVVSSASSTGLSVVSNKFCDDPKEEEVVTIEEGATKTMEVEADIEEQELGIVANSATLPTMDDSPILGILSKPEALEPVTEKVVVACAEDGVSFCEWSPVKEITGEINRASEGNKVDAGDVPEEKILAIVTGNETSEENGLNEVKEACAHVMPEVDLTVDETSEEDLNEVNEVAADEMPHADLITSYKGSGEEVDLNEDSSEEEILDEESADATEDNVSSDDTEKEIDGESEFSREESANEATEENVSSDEKEIDGESDFSEVATDSDEEGELEIVPPTITIETENGTKEDRLIAENNHVADEEDDFTDDLPPEFSSDGNSSDCETESDTTLVTSSAAKTASVKNSLDDSSVTEELDVSSEKEVSQHELGDQLNTIVKSLDEITISVNALAEEKSADADAVVKKKQQKKLTVDELKAYSMRKLKAMYKEAKEAAGGKRLALAEMDDNACVDC